MPANEKRHVFTNQMRVAVSPEQDEMLREYAARFGRVERTLYRDLENGEDAQPAQVRVSTPARESFPEPFGKRWHKMP